MQSSSLDRWECQITNRRSAVLRQSPRVSVRVFLDDLGNEIFESILAVASGQRTKSELAGVGQEEFNPWILGAML